MTRFNRWRKPGTLFGIAGVSSMLFLLCTTLAMVTYPGGTSADPSLNRYQFFGNIFSDLGMLRTPGGQSNHLSMAFFAAALLSVAAGICEFFVAFMVIASGRTAKILGLSAAILGAGAALCCIGIACTPCDLYLQAHLHFVVWAAEGLLIATSLDLIAVIADHRLPNHLLWGFTIFAIMLCGYVALLTVRLPMGSIATNVRISGQKLIVYAGIVTLGAQSLQMRRVVRRRENN